MASGIAPFVVGVVSGLKTRALRWLNDGIMRVPAAPITASSASTTAGAPPITCPMRERELWTITSIPDARPSARRSAMSRSFEIIASGSMIST